ncbi:hypothetical protein BpHYR1_040814 [Brachionus plicatilis]|uniref:Uncharacterized protein n=1 Tax=Brachionus plicatilis TaxID=10195 RepID=A0A3M7RDZ6_BRAPC|nr:hypothetical protein BpHYR1_040814 [Brachionus plicatilis]
MSLSILVDNGEALISFSCTFLSNGSDLTQRGQFDALLNYQIFLKEEYKFLFLLVHLMEKILFTLTDFSCNNYPN